MRNILLRLCGYRKYRFVLFTGQRVSFWAKTRGQAIQKALNLEQRIRFNREQTMSALNTLHASPIPDELLQNVLGENPDRSAIAG